MGGTSMFSKVPLMESLPPMAATPSSSWARDAPSSAAQGLAPAFGVSAGLLEIFLEGEVARLSNFAPAATSLETDSTTAR